MSSLKEDLERLAEKQVSFNSHKKKAYYRYLGVDGRFHEIEEGKRVEVLPVGYGYTG